ncbi:MAG: BREX-1 system adenine-specific DNA-methyltransferase PglX, partial [Methanobacterium sp.]
MDKKAIKTFAIESRKKLIEEVKYQASLLGITAKGIAEPVEKADGIEVYDIGASNPNTIYDEAIQQRKNLVKRINEKGFDNVVEEVAYTWFNRIIAIRFMEVNDYLPTRVRVLSSDTEGKIEPDIVTEAPHIDLGFTEEEIEQIYQLKNDNKLDELFRLLFIKQCNKLNEILPELFEKTADYTELLLSISFTNEEGVVRQLIDNISQEDFRDQVEIIGWLYQYYNTELKDDTFKQLKKRVKISKDRIPAATQLFTPDWIVRYMVENSLGRLWLDGHPDSSLKENWKYYLDEAEQEPEVQLDLAQIQEDAKNIKPEDIKIIDPAMGSGHILVYAFEVLMQIYTSVGYSKKDAAVSILKNNIYGLDIDDRAYQLAYLSLMLKARVYNKGILTKKIEPQISSIQESNVLPDELIDFIADNNLEIKGDLKYLKDIFKNAKEYGSIIEFKSIDIDSLLDRLTEIKETNYDDFYSIKYQNQTNYTYKILIQTFILSEKYDVVITNPPYMGNNGMNKNLLNYLKKNFPDSKKDLFAVFIEKCLKMVVDNRYLAMITQQA